MTYTPMPSIESFDRDDTYRMNGYFQTTGSNRDGAALAVLVGKSKLSRRDREELRLLILISDGPSRQTGG